MPLTSNRRRALLALLATLVHASSVMAAAAPAVKTVRVLDGGIFPQADVDADGVIHLVYVKGDPMKGDLFYVSSKDGGDTFAKPIRVNSQPACVMLAGTIRGPQMAVGRGGRVHVAWMGADRAEPRAVGDKTPMLYARLADAGDGFEPQRNVIQEHPGLDGGGSVAADRDGNVYVGWHAPGRTGADKEADRRVWLVRSTDDGKTFGKEAAADVDPKGACGCCGMKLRAGDKGRVYLTYRTASEMVNRDMRLLASDDFGKSFKVVTFDPWRVAQCVMSTSAIAAAPDGAVVAAWETTQDIHLALKASASAAPKPVAVPGQGKNRKHPSVARNGAGDFVVAWTEGTAWKQGGTLAWQAYGKDGRPIAGDIGTAPGVPAWSVPAVVYTGRGSFVVIY